MKKVQMNVFEECIDIVEHINDTTACSIAIARHFTGMAKVVYVNTLVQALNDSLDRIKGEFGEKILDREHLRLAMQETEGGVQ